MAHPCALREGKDEIVHMALGRAQENENRVRQTEGELLRWNKLYCRSGNTLSKR